MLVAYVRARVWWEGSGWTVGAETTCQTAVLLGHKGQTPSMHVVSYKVKLPSWRRLPT